jgi:hypothetical protein
MDEESDLIYNEGDMYYFVYEDGTDKHIDAELDECGNPVWWINDKMYTETEFKLYVREKRIKNILK